MEVTLTEGLLFGTRMAGIEVQLEKSSDRHFLGAPGCNEALKADKFYSTAMSQNVATTSNSPPNNQWLICKYVLFP